MGRATKTVGKVPEYRLYIGGEWVEAKSAETFDVVSPASGEVTARCAKGTRDDVDAAVRAAAKA